MKGFLCTLAGINPGVAVITGKYRNKTIEAAVNVIKPVYGDVNVSPVCII